MAKKAVIRFFDKNLDMFDGEFNKDIVSGEMHFYVSVRVKCGACKKEFQRKIETIPMSAAWTCPVCKMQNVAHRDAGTDGSPKANEVE